MNTLFYVTTPIYYVNDEPHLGHAYTTILADVLARFAKLRGSDVFFLTGTDEHGQKVQNAAHARRTEPQLYVNEMVKRYRSLWDYLHIEFSDFIRTTETRHVKVVQAVLQRLWDQGEIYRDQYEGWYCVPDERFWTEKDLNEGMCPDCGRPVEHIAEDNYFFRMKKYQSWLIEYITDNPAFIRPETRRNEVLGFLKQPLGDLCISRPKSRLSWGISLPFDDDYVTYVWFDALLNYISAPGYLDNTEQFDRYWPSVLHLIGKDILITHSVYWPTMLKAANIAPPHTILAHGWWVVEGTKMSKSLGNVVKPLDLAQVFGVDAFRYFLIRDMTLGNDANFSEERLQQRYQADLSNDLGNLLHRIVTMIERYCGREIPVPTKETPLEQDLRQKCIDMVQVVLTQTASLGLDQALASITEVVKEINIYLDRTSPWKLAKRGQMSEVAAVLYTASEALRLTAVLLWPVMPERMSELWKRLGWRPPSPLSDSLKWGSLEPGTKVVSGPPLFPRDINLE